MIAESNPEEKDVMAKQIILQEVNCLILKEYNKTIVTDLEKSLNCLSKVCSFVY
ncbi:hypothetical protein [Eubacterium oxidoreducens]|uniref:hypothetical protein n=1 Tax=Eubacterium oxidoreducens TaxID=1732 RepID=UPI0015A4033C|nr:hypothetical protein [Eubacterium oxidoreducens]